MSESMDHSGKQRGYGLFVVAAAIYTAGVVAFSGWSYLRHRADLHAQVDQSLINATYATEQVLGGIFLECAVETETVHEMGYVANQAKLNSLADDCRFDALGAVGRNGTNLWVLVAGGKQNGFIPSGTLHFQDPLPPEPAAIALETATSGDGCIQIKTMQVEGYGELRIAVRYHATSTDAGYALMVARSTLNMNRLLRALALRTLLISIFLYAMAFPLIALYNRTHEKVARKLAELNTRLQQDAIKQKAREVELEDAIRDLERFNAITLGREDRIIGLKAEVNTLLEQMKRKNRYGSEKKPSPNQSQDG